MEAWTEIIVSNFVEMKGDDTDIWLYLKAAMKVKIIKHSLVQSSQSHKDFELGIF